MFIRARSFIVNKMTRSILGFFFFLKKSTNFCGPAIRTLGWFWAMVWSKWTKIWVDICDTLGKYRPIMVIWAITLLVFKKKSTGDHPRLVNNFSQKRLEGFLSFFAWMFRTIIARNAHGGFSEKNSGFLDNCENVLFSGVFQLFLGNRSKYFAQTWPECSLYDNWPFAKNRMSKSFPFSRFSILKAVKTPKNAFLLAGFIWQLVRGF